MFRAQKHILYLILLLSALFFNACEDNNDSSPDPAQSSQWDKMEWDKGKWE